MDSVGPFNLNMYFFDYDYSYLHERRVKKKSTVIETKMKNSATRNLTTDTDTYTQRKQCVVNLQVKRSRKISCVRDLVKSNERDFFSVNPPFVVVHKNGKLGEREKSETNN